MATTYDPNQPVTGPDGGTYSVTTDAANGIQVWTPSKMSDSGTMIPDASRADKVFVTPIPDLANKPKDLSAVRLVTTAGPQGIGQYAVKFGADGHAEKNTDGTAAMQFVGTDVKLANPANQVRTDGDGNLVAITQGPDGKIVSTQLTHSDGKLVSGAGTLLRGVGTSLTGIGALLRSPAQAAQYEANAAKTLLGPALSWYEPSIQQAAADPAATPEQRLANVESLIRQAMVSAKTGMDAYNRAYIQHFTDETAATQANTRATIAGTAMKDFMGGIQNLASPISGDQAGSVFRGFMAMQQQAQQGLGGSPVPLGRGSAGVPLGTNDPNQATALAMTKAFSDKYGIPMGDAASLLNDNLTSEGGFSGLADKLPGLATMPGPLSDLMSANTNTSSLGESGKVLANQAAGIIPKLDVTGGDKAAIASSPAYTGTLGPVTQPASSAPALLAAAQSGLNLGGNT